MIIKIWALIWKIKIFEKKWCNTNKRKKFKYVS